MTAPPVVASRFTALRYRDFTMLWAGMGVSQLGTQIQRVAVAWQLYELTHSAVALGLLGLFRVLPVIILALGAGVIADAVDRRRLALVTQTVLALCSTGLAILTATHHMSATAIYALAFAAGSANAFDNPARSALIPNLVPREILSNALSLNVTTWQVASVVGPTLGGLLLAKWGVTTAYVLDAISFSAVIASLAFMHHRAPAPPSSRISLGAAVEGVRFLFTQRVMMGLMLLDFFGTFFAGALLLMPIFADQVLHEGRFGLGLLYAAPSVGAVAAALVMSVTPEVKRRGVVVIACVLIYGAAITGFGASTSFALSLLLLAISGAADTVSMVIRQTVRNLLTPDELRGRMTAVNMIFFVGGPQLGEVEAGLVASWIGAPLSVVTGGIACVVVAIVVAAAVPAVRRHTA